MVAFQSRGSGEFAHFSGIEMSVNCQQKSVDINTIAGKPFEAKQKYSFTWPRYNAAGGNGYPVLTDAVDTGFIDADILLQYVRQNNPINPNSAEYRNTVTFTDAETVWGCDN